MPILNVVKLSSYSQDGERYRWFIVESSAVVCLVDRWVLGVGYLPATTMSYPLVSYLVHGFTNR